MKPSTAIRVAATAVATGLSLYSGGTFTPLLTSFLGTEQIDRFTKVTEELASHWLAGLFEDWSKDPSHESEKRQNHAVLRGVYLAIANCLEKAAGSWSDAEGQKYLNALARSFSEDTAKLKVESFPISLSENELTDLVSGRTAIDTHEWEELLESVAPELDLPGTLVQLSLNLRANTRKSYLRRAAEILAIYFSKELRRAYEKLGAENDSAWMALVVRFLGEIHGNVKEAGANINRLADHLTRIDGAIANLNPSVASQRDAQVDAQFIERVLSTLGETRQLVKKIHDRLLKSNCLKDMLQHPWELKPSQLPFLYNRRDTVLFGALAKKMLAIDLTEFLSGPQGIRWWLWTGLEGTGKSHLAMECCIKAIDELGWKAGFVSQTALESFDGGWLNNCTIEDDILLVFDYAGFDPKRVRQALYALCTRSTKREMMSEEWRIRVLLLERHIAPLNPAESNAYWPQWCIELFDLTTHRLETEIILDHQYTGQGGNSFHLGTLDLDNARNLADQYLKNLDLVSPASGQPLSDIERAGIAADSVALLAGNTRPLHIKITARVLRDTKRKDYQDFDDVIKKWLRVRVPLRRERLKQIYPERGRADQLLNLLCVATVLGQLSLDKIPRHELLPGPETLRDNRFLNILEQPIESTVLSKLEPDLIGEWFVLFRTELESPNAGLTPSVLSRILEECQDSKKGVEAFVQRTYRNFHDKSLENGKKSSLWRVLRGTLGRYATPFGRLFDRKQAELLGGTTKQAEECYRALVVSHIEAAIQRDGGALVVELMAGGKASSQWLLQMFGRKIMLLAIDRDDSRLVGIQSSHSENYYVKKLQLDGRCDLVQVLSEAFQERQCDVVLAKKALHELPWESQKKVISELGHVVRPGGSVIVYADSPKFIDPAGIREWNRISRLLHTNLSVDGADDSPKLREKIFPPNLQFISDNHSDAAIFTNTWIKLKDWANYNGHEFENRYFSSRNEIEWTFAEAGFESKIAPAPFHMELQPSLFVEDAINRLGYLCVDPTITPAELEDVFHQNERYRLFREFSEAHLWTNGEQSEFGRSIGAKSRDGVELKDLVIEAFPSDHRSISFPYIDEPSFEMPIHVFEFFKR